jgi:hypothetical protein
MQQRPDLIALLAAVERFLREDLPGAVADERLKYRVLVAQSLVGQAAAELHADADRRAAAAAMAARDAELAARIRAGGDDLDEAAIRRQLLAELGGFLAVTSPRFDRRIDAESGKSKP